MLPPQPPLCLVDCEPPRCRHSHRSSLAEQPTTRIPSLRRQDGRQRGSGRKKLYLHPHLGTCSQGVRFRELYISCLAPLSHLLSLPQLVVEPLRKSLFIPVIQVCKTPVQNVGFAVIIGTSHSSSNSLTSVGGSGIEIKLLSHSPIVCTKIDEWVSQVWKSNLGNKLETTLLVVEGLSLSDLWGYNTS